MADIEEIATRSEINESASQVFDPGTFQSKETPYLPVKREETHSSSPYGPPVLWNIFARELEKILNQRGLTITRLDDLKVVTHPMKIKRLKASLSAPKSLTTLNTEEMQRLQDILALDQSEMLTLRAALLATAVERTLMDRTEPQLALMAANDVFRLLHQAMLNDPITYLPQATE